MHEVCKELQRMIPFSGRPQSVASPVRLAEEACVVCLREIVCPVVVFIDLRARDAVTSHWQARLLRARVHGAQTPNEEPSSSSYYGKTVRVEEPDGASRFSSMRYRYA